MVNSSRERNNIARNETKLKIRNFAKGLVSLASTRKKLLIIAIILILVISFISIRRSSRAVGGSNIQKVIVNIANDFEFTALNNQGQPTGDRLKLRITTAEKTNQVLVKDQVFTARNNKLFLIVNLEITNSTTLPLNLLTGNLVRLTVGDDEQTKFAPDLHNNLVPIAPLSTKIDRLGFVIPDNTKTAKLHVGELEGEKRIIVVNFPS